MSDVFKALADPTRRSILRMLRDRNMSAGEIAARVNASKPTLSGHLSVLHAANLVHRERRGTTIIYHLKLSVLEEAWMYLASSMRFGEEANPCTEELVPPSP